MRQLVLCQSCKRHVKISEAQCPFCSATVVSSLAPERARSELARGQNAASARGRPGGRAALFLAGAVLAAGCGDDVEPDDESDDEHSVPVYGVAIDRPPKDAGLDAGRDAGRLGTVPYGIAIDRRDASIATPADAGPRCPQLGNLPVPVYGIGIDAPARDMCTDAVKDGGLDAGANAGKDGGLDAGKDAGRDAETLSHPVYGVSIDTNR